MHVYRVQRTVQLQLITKNNIVYFGYSLQMYSSLQYASGTHLKYFSATNSGTPWTLFHRVSAPSWNLPMTEEIDRHVLRKYEVQQKLGKGVGCNLLFVFFLIVSFGAQAYGIVWKSLDKKTRDTVALKKIFDAFQNATDAQVS